MSDSVNVEQPGMVSDHGKKDAFQGQEKTDQSISKMLDVPATPAVDKVQIGLKKLNANKESISKPSIKNVVKLLQSLQSKPDDVKNRKLRMENMIVKKFILDVPGALDVMEAVGFVKVEAPEKKAFYLEIAEAAVDTQLISRTIEMLESQLKDVETRTLAPKPDGDKRKACAGGCGFYGDEKQEDLCSQCFRKKYFGGTEKKDVKDSKPEVPKKLCTKGCGFWGSETFEGMCSKCYKVAHPELIPKPKHWRARLKSARVKLRAVRRFRLSIVKESVQTNKTRCWTCKRKVGITGIECRCKFVFCGKHRYPDEHDCSFDFKQQHRRKLEKENQRVEGSKFEKL